MPDVTRSSLALHLFAVLVAACTAVLIFAGGLVTSTDSGLAVPDWPNTYGWFMFSFPVKYWVGGIFYEHTHRLIASTVGFLILVLAFWLWRSEPRRWVRRLGLIALAAVIVQGLLGGITVLYFLPKPVSITHASLAQLVFCLTVTIALVTSRGWARASAPLLAQLSDDRLLQRLAIVMTATIYLQVVVGATMRHNDAGLAIPDFPLMFGQLVPPHWDVAIAIHFAHRVGAAIVSLLVLATAGHVLYHHRRQGSLVRGSALLLVLLSAQITLGALTVLTGLHYVINSLHVVTGASLLGAALVLTLRVHRARFTDPGAGRRADSARAGLKPGESAAAGSAAASRPAAPGLRGAGGADSARAGSKAGGSAVAGSATASQPAEPGLRQFPPAEPGLRELRPAEPGLHRHQPEVPV